MSTPEQRDRESRESEADKYHQLAEQEAEQRHRLAEWVREEPLPSLDEDES